MEIEGEKAKHNFPVSSLDRGAPIHASAKGIDFAEVVGMHIGMGQSATMDSLRLMVDLSFGWVEFTQNYNGYRLALRNARLFLECANSDVVPGSSYKAELQEGSIKQHTKGSYKSNAATGMRGELSGDASASLRSFVLGWVLRVKASGGGSAAKDENRTKTEETIITSRLELVAPAGQNCWMIGCPGKGDPRHERGFLTGEIISATDGDAPTPLCLLSAVDQSQPVVVRLVVTADREYFCLSDDSSRDKNIEEVLSNLETINTQTIRRRVRAERDLKSRVAALAATRTLMPKTREFGMNALILMQWSIVFNPRIDAGGGHGRRASK